MELIILILLAILFIKPIMIAITTVLSMFVYSIGPAMLVFLFLLIFWSVGAVFSFIPSIILVGIVLYVFFKLFDK